jgi:biopolymer transport protein ExbB/TolQ
MVEAAVPTLVERLALVWAYWCAGGWLMLPLAIIMFGIWQRYFALRQALAEALQGGHASVDEVERRWRGPASPRELGPWLAAAPGAVPRVLHHCFARVTAGLPFREAFAQCREAELAPFHHAFYGLGAMVTAAPLLGLLGTVLGMIDTFDAVALRSGETAELVAGGIAEALITTQVGLIAALPGAFGLAHLYRLYRQLQHDLDQAESHLYLRCADLPGATP